MPNLQRNHNRDGSITIYLKGHKQFRGTLAQAQRYIEQYYRKRPGAPIKDTTS